MGHAQRQLAPYTLNYDLSPTEEQKLTNFVFPQSDSIGRLLAYIHEDKEIRVWQGKN